MRLKATVLGKSILLPEVVDSSCLGAAILAAGADGGSGSSSAAAAMVHMKREYEPESSVAPVYADRFQEYCSIREIWVRNHRSFRFWSGGPDEDA
jgi:sugar (pentulose or hexulose) kinase